MLVADPSKARLVEVLDEIGRPLVEAKSVREAMSLVTRADRILGRVAKWAHQSPTPDEVRRTFEAIVGERRASARSQPFRGTPPG
jgi:hypothetical protein